MRNGMDKIKVFAQEIIALISSGKKETITDIEKHMCDGDLVQYIREKYYDDLSNEFKDDKICNIKAWNDAFTNYYGYVNGDENRKFGIVNEEDGLLLVVTLIINIITEK